MQGRNIFMGVLALAVMSGTFGLVFLLFFAPIPDSSHDLVNVALGALLTAQGTVVSYYFGSSKSSRDKDQRANAQTPPESQA
jgi:hypothetical protein